MRRYGDISELSEISIRSTTGNRAVTLKKTADPGADRDIELPSTSTTLIGTDTTDTLTNKTLTSPVINTPTGIVKGDVGLGNVDNTSDATKNAASVSLTNKTITDGSNNISASVLTSGTLPDARLSGTAFDSISPMNTNGDIIYRSGGVAARLGHPGVGGQVLTTDGVAGFTWSSPLVNPMDAAGEIIYGGASGAATALAAGSTNDVLISNGTGAPQWSTIGTDSITNGAVTDVKIAGTITGSKIEAATASVPGVVSISAQTFAGKKTFTGKILSQTASSGVTASTTADQLVAEGSAGSGISILSGSSSEGRLAFGDIGDSVVGRIVYNHNDNSMRFGTNTTSDWVILDNVGNLGIGEASTAAKLHVKGGVFTGRFESTAQSIVESRSLNIDNYARFRLSQGAANIWDFNAQPAADSQALQLLDKNGHEAVRIEQDGEGLRCLTSQNGVSSIGGNTTTGASVATTKALQADMSTNVSLVLVTNASNGGEYGLFLANFWNNTVTTLHNALQGGITVTSATNDTTVSVNNNTGSTKVLYMQFLGSPASNPLVTP